MNKIECNLWLGETLSTGVMVKCEVGGEPTVDQQGSLTADEHAASHFLVEIVRCLSLGKSIDHTFSPLLTPDKVKEQETLVKCRWSKSGKLLMFGETTKHWKHAVNVEEAVVRNRVFTCTRSVFNATPKRRLRG